MGWQVGDPQMSPPWARCPLASPSEGGRDKLPQGLSWEGCSPCLLESRRQAELCLAPPGRRGARRSPMRCWAHCLQTPLPALAEPQHPPCLHLVDP